MWALELDRAETRYKFRLYQPPFYSFLYSVHSELPNFLINTHTVTEAGDMGAYNSRVRAIPTVLDTAIAQSKLSDATGVHAPRFEIERVISGSKVIITGAPFDAGKDSPLWADAKAKVAKLQAAGKVNPADANALLADSRASILALKPPTSASSLGLRRASTARAAASVRSRSRAPTGTQLRSNQHDARPDGRRFINRVTGSRMKGWDALARQSGFKDRNAFTPTAPALARRDRCAARDYLKRANGAIAHNRSLLPEQS
jgi:hypothetical protein